jgi:hypothetical protein
LRQSVLELAGIPKEFGITLLVVALIFVVAPYLAGTDFGILKVPTFPPPTKKRLRVTGPFFMLVIVALHLPLMPKPESSEPASEKTARELLVELRATRERVGVPANATASPEGEWRILVVNKATKLVSAEEAQKAVDAINVQIRRDFSPYWKIHGVLKLGDESEKPSVDAVVNLLPDTNVDDALGYHEVDATGMPFANVFVALAKAVETPWSVILSHEVLDLLADPYVNLLITGPHPAKPSEEVFHWREVATAVQDQVYELDGVAVSNFVLPTYYQLGSKGYTDYLGKTRNTRTLAPFDVSSGGYIGYYNPRTRQHETFARASK